MTKSFNQTATPLVNSKLNSMNRIIALLALLGFMLSLAVHISALIGIDVSSKFPYVWALHIGIFIVFIPFVILSRKDLGNKPSFSQIRDRFPTLIISIGLLIFVYAFINFYLFMNISHEGTPIIKEGKFILQNHGRFIREITNNEYIALKANVVRGFSGHWLVFISYHLHISCSLKNQIHKHNCLIRTFKFESNALPKTK